MILGNKPEPAKDVELFTDKGKKIYVAQTGLIGGAFPTHKTEFKLVPGPLKLEDGKNTLEVKFEGEAGGVKVVKTYILSSATTMASRFLIKYSIIPVMKSNLPFITS